MKNCFTMAFWFRIKFGGELFIVNWGRPWVHFGVRVGGGYYVHYKADNNRLPLWHLFHFDGKMVVEYEGCEG